ncbi:hypothetical protein LB504_003586, partial [Fusarium proliferatum]
GFKAVFPSCARGFETLRVCTQTSIENEIKGTLKKEDDDDEAAGLLASIDEQCTRSFVTHAAQPIFQLTLTPSAAAAAEFEGEFDDEVARLFEMLRGSLLAMQCQGPILSGPLEKADVPDPVAKEGETFNAVVEAAQLAENLSLAVQAQWQFACSIYIGDIRQLPPIAVTVDQQDFKAIISLQRKTILFHRMENAGQIHFRLRRNYRAYVHSHELAQNMFYRDLRGQENSEPYCGGNTPATRIFMNWVDKQFVRFHTKSSTILIRPGSCSETVCGTSYYNEGYANFVIQLIIQFSTGKSHPSATIEDDVSSHFNDIGSDEEFLTYSTVLVKSSHAHKAVILRELEKLFVWMALWMLTDASQVSSWGCLSMTLLIRPDNAEESKGGNSISNPANAKANFTVQLVVQLYRDAALVDARDFSKRASVLILAPYKEQKRLYDLLLRQLTEAEVPKDLVEVRTVDDSPSHEADVVILDLPGHIATERKFEPKCVRCGGASHATRNCPRAEEDAISTSASEPITADDGIQRDVLNPPRVNFSDSKRSKKNSTTREEAFAKPDKHKDAMRKAFRNAMQGLRKVKKDQDVQDAETDEHDQAGDDGADDGVW